MPLKVQITLHCAECDKKVPLKGKTFTEHSRRHGSYSGVLLPDVYVVSEPDEYNGWTDMKVSRGLRYLGDGDVPTDDEGLVCGIECAIKRMTKVIRKLRAEVIEKEED
jgi:hypothetical protein